MKRLLVLAAALVGFSAGADVAGPLWSCKINGNISGKSVSVGLSFSKLEGKGQLNCESMNGVKQDIPVTIEIAGIGVGLGATEYKSIEVATATIGLAEGPEALVGTYSVGATAGVTLVQAGFDVGAAVKLSKEGGLGFELGFLGKQAEGLEARVQLQTVKIMADTAQ